MAEIYDPWLRSLRWNILLLLGFCTQGVFAATDTLELAGVIAAGIIGLFLLTSSIIAVLYFCKRLKQNRKKQIIDALDIRKLRESIYQPPGSALSHSAVVNRLPNALDEDIYRETVHSIYNGSIGNLNQPHPLSGSKTNYLERSRKESYRKSFSQNYERITDYNTSQPLNPLMLQTNAMVHENYDYSMERPNTDLAHSRVDSDFILKKREDIPLDLRRSKRNEVEDVSATDFMLERQRERLSHRSDLGYITNDNNPHSLQNGGRFLTVEDRSRDEYPAPDYDRNEKEQVTIPRIQDHNRGGYNMDLEEIKKNFSLDVPERSYKGSWYDSFSKQVQFNSNPENIAISNVSLRS